jgi:hypothetical protein
MGYFFSFVIQRWQFADLPVLYLVAQKNCGKIRLNVSNIFYSKKESKSKFCPKKNLIFFGVK